VLVLVLVAAIPHGAEDVKKKKSVTVENFPLV